MKRYVFIGLCLITIIAVFFAIYIYYLSYVEPGIAARVWGFVLQSYRKAFWQISTLVAVTILILLLDLYVSGWAKSALHSILRPSKSVGNDIVSFVLIVTQIHEILGFGFFFFLTFYIRRGINDLFGFQVLRSVEPHLIQFIIFFVLVDFLDYWFHRFEHRFAFLWSTHKFHHSSDEFVIITAKRVHPLNDVSLKRLFFALPFALIGTPVESFISFVVVRHILSLLQHSNFNWNFGVIGQYLLVSPVAHRVHHSTNEGHFNANYGTIFIFWDRLFGTYCGDGYDKVTQLGVQDCNHGKNGYFSNVIDTYFEAVGHLGSTLKMNFSSLARKVFRH